jgi:hypothetical protein
MVAGALALSACGQPKATGEARPAPQAATPVQPVSILQEAPPPPPAWAAALIDKPLRDRFPAEGACTGNTDAVGALYVGATRGAKIVGWGWDTGAREPVRRVVLVDPAGKVVGAGETGIERPDVVAARRNITSGTTGWWAVTALDAGQLDAYGLLPDGKSACRLGHIAF